jgi:hypothetical protein
MLEKHVRRLLILAAATGTFHPTAAAESRKSTVSVTVTVAPSCQINANGVDPSRCPQAMRPLVSMNFAPASSGATASADLVRTINF